MSITVAEHRHNVSLIKEALKSLGIPLVGGNIDGILAEEAARRSEELESCKQEKINGHPVQFDGRYPTNRPGIRAGSPVETTCNSLQFTQKPNKVKALRYLVAKGYTPQLIGILNGVVLRAPFEEWDALLSKNPRASSKRDFGASLNMCANHVVISERYFEELKQLEKEINEKLAMLEEQREN